MYAVAFNHSTLLKLTVRLMYIWVRLGFQLEYQELKTYLLYGCYDQKSGYRLISLRKFWIKITVNDVIAHVKLSNQTIFPKYIFKNSMWILWTMSVYSTTYPKIGVFKQGNRLPPCWDIDLCYDQQQNRFPLFLTPMIPTWLTISSNDLRN